MAAVAVVEKTKQILVVTLKCSCGNVADMGYIPFFEEHVCSECVEGYEQYEYYPKNVLKFADKWADDGEELPF